VSKVTKPDWLCHFAVKFAVKFDMATKRSYDRPDERSIHPTNSIKSMKSFCQNFYSESRVNDSKTEAAITGPCSAR